MNAVIVVSTPVGTLAFNHASTITDPPRSSGWRRLVSSRYDADPDVWVVHASFLSCRNVDPAPALWIVPPVSIVSTASSAPSHGWPPHPAPWSAAVAPSTTDASSTHHVPAPAEVCSTTRYAACTVADGVHVAVRCAHPVPAVGALLDAMSPFTPRRTRRVGDPVARTHTATV